jgi:hypothetical protein
MDSLEFSDARDDDGVGHPAGACWNIGVAMRDLRRVTVQGRSGGVQAWAVFLLTLQTSTTIRPNSASSPLTGRETDDV